MIRIILLLILALGSIGFAQDNRRKTDKLFFQPVIHYKDGSNKKAGSGFFVSGPDSRLYGITCAHILGDGEVVKIDWTDTKTGAVVASFDSTIGPPGSPGVDLPAYDHRSDFLILPLPEGSEEPDCLALSLQKDDESVSPAWLPYRDAAAKLGWQKVPVEICGVEDGVIGGYSAIKGKYQGRSGSPLLSASGNRVLGLLVKEEQLFNGKAAVLFAPVNELKFQLQSEKDLIKLSNYDPGAGGAGAVPNPPSTALIDKLDGGTWSGTSPAGNTLSISFDKAIINWDSRFDFTDEYREVAKNRISVYWKRFNNLITMQFSDDFSECQVIFGSGNESTLTRQ